MSHCPDRDRLERLLDHRLDDTELDEIEEHIEACAACQLTLDELTGAALCDIDPGRGGLITPMGAEPDIGAGATAAANGITARVVPTVAGYDLKRELGRGGMGVVYGARHVRLNRPCALKMILAGAHADPEDIARFVTEAEAIARLEHPSIVQIHAIGEADGLPFFELEYLAGGSLDQQLDGTPWPATRAALLAEQVALAIALAHRLGIVHRDLKPSNVFLAADGTPKVGDFGLAKLLDSQSALTRGESVMGSPSYMAPEQAGGKIKQVGPLADVYALGAILYELLVGRPPFRGATVLETLEQVKTTEPVPPSRLVPGLPRDIETICLKCLEKEPEKRFETSQALADDLRRFLDGDPVRACPPSVLYRFHKLARKHRAALVTIASFIAMLLVISAVSTWQAIRATRAEGAAKTDRNKAVAARISEAEQRKRAEEAEKSARADYDRAKAMNAFLIDDLLTQAEPRNNAVEDHVTLLEVLNRAADKVGQRFASRPELEAQLRSIIAQVYHGLASLERAEAQWIAVYDAQRKRNPESAETLVALSELRHVQLHRGRRDASCFADTKAAADGLARLRGPASAATLRSREHLAWAYQLAQQIPAAISVYEETLKLRMSTPDLDDRDMIMTRSCLASAYQTAGRTGQAIAARRGNALTITTMKFGPDNLLTLECRDDLGFAYAAAGRTAEAIALLEETLSRLTRIVGTDHSVAIHSRNHLAGAYRAVGQFGKAIPLLEQDVKLTTAKHGVDDPETLRARNDLGVAYAEAGRTAEAITLQEETLRYKIAKLGPDDPETLTTRSNLAKRVSEGRARGRSDRNARRNSQAKDVEIRPQPRRHAHEPQQPRLRLSASRTA